MVLGGFEISQTLLLYFEMFPNKGRVGLSFLFASIPSKNQIKFGLKPSNMEELKHLGGF